VKPLPVDAGLPIGPEPDGIDDDVVGGALFEPEWIQNHARDVKGRLVEYRHQVADSAFEGGKLGRCGSEALEDELFESRGSCAVIGADGGFELCEQVVQRKVGG
jgi:hypothetical protein